MKKSLAIAWLCLMCFPVFGQTTYSGTMAHQGTLNYGGSSSAPLTYPARTDNCETGSESGCISGTSVGQQGATLSYQGRVGDDLPSLGGLSGAGDGSAHCVTDPDFGAVICRLTDYTHFNSAGLSWNLGSSGGQHRFSADSPPSLLLANTGGGSAALIGLSYSGSGSSTAVASTLTALYGSQLPASGYVFSMQTANVLWELVPGQYTPAGAVATPPTTCSSGAGCEYVNQINKLILGCTSGTIPLCAGGSLVVSRTKVFDFNCEGAGCPTTSSNQNFSGGHNMGTDSPNCLPANWDATWNGTFMVSDDDTSVTEAFSDNGQGGQPGTGNCTKGSSAGSCLGAVYLANFTIGKGCRALNTHTMSATGDYGPTGAMINSQSNAITGVANQVLPDTFDMHDGNQLPNASYAGFVPGALPACVAPPTVGLQSFTTDSGGTPTFTTTATNSFFVGQTVGFNHVTESWLRGAYLVVATITDGTHFTTGPLVGHNSYSSGAEPGNAIVTSALSNNCQCGNSGTAIFCQLYHWHIADLTVDPCGSGVPITPCAGHQAIGFINAYIGKRYTATNYSNWNLPTVDASGVACTPGGNCDLLPAAVPVDQHGTYLNRGSSNQAPVFMASTNVCGQQVGNQGAGACDAEYTTAWYDEVFAAENFATNSNAKHCSGAPCAYRFAHTGNTGTNWNFNLHSAISTISSDGKWMAVPTDWGLGFGCTDGSTSCLTSLQATAPPDETITAWSTDSSSTYLTITVSAATDFVLGQPLTLSGTGAGWLDGIALTISSPPSGSTFVATGIPTGEGSLAGSAGTAKATACANAQYMPCQRGDIVIVALPTAHQ